MPKRFDGLLNIIAVALFLSTAGLWWDGWWHVTMGRDSMWVPPHILQYTNVIVLFFSSIYLYYKTRLRTYKFIFYYVVIFIFMAPADELWHHFFGIENLSTPLALWSPPHIIAILANLSIALTFLIDWIKKYTDSDKRAFLRIVLVSSVCLSMASFIIIPLQPFGFYFILGSYGVLITMSILTFFFLLISNSLPNSGLIFFTILTFIVFIGFRGINPAPNVILPAYALPPLWLDFIALVPLALFVEFVDIKKYNPILLGTIMGVIPYFFYWIFWNFIQKPESFYDQSDAFIFVIFSAIAGCFSGIVFLKIRRFQLIKSLEH